MGVLTTMVRAGHNTAAPLASQVGPVPIRKCLSNPSAGASTSPGIHSDLVGGPEYFIVRDDLVTCSLFREQDLWKSVDPGSWLGSEA